MEKKRFVYGRSNLYGWVVYDRQRGSVPAYDACATMLPLVLGEGDDLVAQSPILMRSEYAAAKMAMQLNKAYKFERKA